MHHKDTHHIKHQTSQGHISNNIVPQAWGFGYATSPLPVCKFWCLEFIYEFVTVHCTLRVFKYTCYSIYMYNMHMRGVHVHHLSLYIDVISYTTYGWTALGRRAQVRRVTSPLAEVTTSRFCRGWSIAQLRQANRVPNMARNRRK